MIKITLDNIIFSLQKSGGASVVWQQHLQRLLKDLSFECSLLEFDNAGANIFRQLVSIDEDKLNKHHSSFLLIKRYLDLYSFQKEKHLFHSSHYRIQNAKNVINVTTVHDFTYEYFAKGFRRKIHTWQKYNAINRSEGIICISNHTKRDLIKFLPNIDQRRIRVIYNGVDEAFRPLQSGYLPAHTSIFDDYKYALYVGDRKVSYKNFDLAINACLIAKTPLLMIGGGELTNLEKEKLKGINYKCITGVSVEDLNFYYNKALCLLYPSQYEGFGIPIVEAQKAGCPVIASNTSSIPEVIANPYLALDELTSDNIARLMNELTQSNSFRTEIIAQGFEKSKELSWQSTYVNTSAFYKELYESKK